MDFAPVQNKINEPELRSDFEEFQKWHFRNEPTLEVFLSQLEKEIFTLSQKPLRYSNLSKAEWQMVRSLANDRNTVIKKADKGSCLVIWDRLYYIMEAEKQLRDKTIYKDVTFNKNIIPNLTEKSNRIFENLKHRGFISEKQLKHFRFH